MTEPTQPNDYEAMQMAAEIEAKGVPADGGTSLFAVHPENGGQS